MIFAVSSVSMFAATKAPDDKSDKFVKVILNFDDGSQKEGYIKEFRIERLIKVYDYSSFGKKTIENEFGLQPSKLTFKKDLDSKSEKISTKDIKSIDFIIGLNSNNIPVTDTYEKVIIATVKNKNKLDKEKAYTFLPVYFKNQKITIYILNIVDQPQFYFKGRGDIYALQHKVLVSDVFKPQRFVDRLYGMFEHIGKDCPDYIEWLNNHKEKAVIEKTWGNKSPESGQSSPVNIIKTYREDIKKARKEMDRKDFKEYSNELEDQKNEDMIDANFNLYNEQVINYINTCE